jgi:hypothetical protein
MVQFKILSGKKAGTTWMPRRFPARIGRASGCDLQLEEHGVWNEHFQIDIHPAAGIVLETQPDALVTANGQPVQRAVLHNGDLVEIGSLKLQFWLSEAEQGGLRSSAWLVSGIIAGVCIAQAVLALLLPH